jgi:pimeloyl-ACP methyl ester carboxylesterase
VTIELRDMGSYFVGGRRVVVEGQPERVVRLSPALDAFRHDPNGIYWIDQAYVQYFVPVRTVLPWPLVLVHGGGLTGSAWETTPDGRPGWLQCFLAAGFEVHVVDNVERGRAGFCALPGHVQDGPIVRSEAEAWRLYRIGDEAGYAGRQPFAGQQFPVAHLEHLARCAVPRWPGRAPLQLQALDALVQRLGECVLVGHSQGGGFVLEVAAARPGQVRAVVALEPHGGQPQCSAGAPPPLLAVLGDFIDRAPVWLDLQRRLLDHLAAWPPGGLRTALRRCWISPARACPGIRTC